MSKTVASREKPRGAAARSPGAGCRVCVRTAVSGWPGRACLGMHVWPARLICPHTRDGASGCGSVLHGGDRGCPAPRPGWEQPRHTASQGPRLGGRAHRAVAPARGLLPPLGLPLPPGPRWDPGGRGEGSRNQGGCYKIPSPAGTAGTKLSLTLGGAFPVPLNLTTCRNTTRGLWKYGVLALSSQEPLGVDPATMLALCDPPRLR